MHNITLATLHLASEQQIFEQVASHLLTQNKKSTDEVYCLYFHPEGLKCAAGCLIGEKEYSKNFENKRWPILITHKLVPDYHAELIIALQRIHDQEKVIIWKENLINFAIKNNLKYSFLNNFS